VFECFDLDTKAAFYGFLKMKGLLARGGKSLQLWWGFANLCFNSRPNSWQVSRVLAVELVKPA